MREGGKEGKVQHANPIQKNPPHNSIDTSSHTPRSIDRSID